MHQTGQEKNTEPLFKSLGYVKYLNVFKIILLCLQLFSVTEIIQIFWFVA